MQRRFHFVRLTLMAAAFVTVLLAGGTVIFAAKNNMSNKNTHELSTTQPNSEFFQLSYPISSKPAMLYAALVTQTPIPRYTDYFSIIDHTPPFYDHSVPTLEPYTGELGQTHIPPGLTGSDDCGFLGPSNRGYCYNGHSGLDIPVTTGTTVYASHAGIVIMGSDSDPDGAYGITVLIRDETNPVFITRYSHLSAALVRMNDHVARGQHIGTSGCTGSGCAGPHLHWGLYYDTTQIRRRPDDSPGQVLDPYGWMSLRPNNIGMGTPVPQDIKWAEGYSSQGPTTEPTTINLNEGTVQGHEYLNKNLQSSGVYQIGGTGHPEIEAWWANSYGSAGPARGDVYFSYYNYEYCQDFEGGTYCTTSGYNPAAYPDVPLTNWAHRYIQWGTREGIISGFPDGTFQPETTVTRQQICKMIVNTFSLPIYTPTTQTFCDVSPGDSQYPYVETLVHAGVISGYDASSGRCPPGCTRCFLPNDPVTRQEMTKFAAEGARASSNPSLQIRIGDPGPANQGPDYWDIPTTSSFFSYVRTLSNIGIIRYHRADGDPACPFGDDCKAMGHFYAGSSATRAQIMQILHETIYNLSCPTPNSCGR